MNVSFGIAGTAITGTVVDGPKSRDFTPPLPLALMLEDIAATGKASQLPIKQWHACLGEHTVTDVIPDRLIHNANRPNLKGESMHQHESIPAARLNQLKLDATLVNVGALELIGGLDGMANGFGSRRCAGSMAGGVAGTRQVIDHCAAYGISTDAPIMEPGRINEAHDRVTSKDVRYRFGMDMGAA